MRNKTFKRDKSGPSLAKRVARLALTAAVVCSFTPLAAFASPIAGGQERSQDPNPEYEQGEILVTLDNAMDGRRIATQSARALTSKLEDALDADSVEVVATASKQSGTVVNVDLADGMSVEAAVAKASELGGVAHAQPNFIYHLLENETPIAPDDDTGSGSDIGDGEQPSGEPFFDDPYIEYQYYLGGWDDGGINASGKQDRGANVVKAWDKAIANHSVSIAILDTGIRVDHEDLQANIDTKNMWDPFSYPDPKTGRGHMTSVSNVTGDRNGHGTHVAGIAAGVAGNGELIAGASGNANIIPIKVFDNHPSKPQADTKLIVQAYDYLLGLVASGELTDLHVINMSLGSYASEGGWDGTDDALRAKIAEARNEGILTVCAGGNGDADNKARTDVSYPSDFDEALSVTALECDGTNAEWSDYNEHKDISAPGVEILSCYNEGSRSYTVMAGTSMASPLVAGIASLLWAVNPALTVDEAINAIEETAHPLDPNGQNYHGDGNVADGSDTGSSGAIDAAAAVALLSGGSDVDYKNMADCMVDKIETQLMKTGSEIVEPAVTVAGDDGGKLTEGNDYVVRYFDNDKVGKAKAVIVGKGSYIGSIAVEFDIKYDIANATGLDFALSQTQFNANDEEHRPAVLAVHNRPDMASSYILTEGTDFTVSYPEDTKASGEKVVTVTGKGDYAGKRELKYVVNANSDGPAASAPASTKKTLKAVCSVADIPDQVYTGAEITPDPVVTAGSKSLVTGKDYTVSYAYNVDAGLATAMITGTGDYSGVLAKRFKILPASISKAAIGSVGGEVYTGKSLKPRPEVSAGGRKLVEGEDYTLSYRDNVNVGHGVVVVSGMGNYTGSVEALFTIGKGTQKLSVKTKDAAVKASALRSKAATIKCLKVTGAKGKVAYKKTSGGSILSVNKKTGKVKVKKGTKPGAYVAQVAVTAGATSNYASATKLAFVTVVVR